MSCCQLLRCLSGETLLYTQADCSGLLCEQAAKLQEILALLDKLEASNPLLNPTEHLEQVAGDWRLLYTTITITVRTAQHSWPQIQWVSAALGNHSTGAGVANSYAELLHAHTETPPCASFNVQGSKKTKLGLREFVKLGDFIQSIDTVNSLAVSYNRVWVWQQACRHRACVR